MQKIILILLPMIAIMALCLFLIPSPNDSSDPTRLLSDHDETEEAVLNVYSVSIVDGITGKALSAEVSINKDQRILYKDHTDDSGHHQFYLEEGDYEVTAVVPGYVTKGKNDIHLIHFEGGDTTINETIALIPQGKIKGNVVSDDGKRKATLQFSYIEDASGAKDYVFHTISSDQTGAFLLENAFGGKMNIEIRADGYMPERLTDIDVQPGQTVDLGDIPLSPSMIIRGVVSDKDSNTAIADAMIQTLDSKGSVIAETKSAEDGSYQLATTDALTVRIEVTADGYQDYSDTLQREQIRNDYPVAMSQVTGLSILVNNITEREPLKTHVTITDIATNKVILENTFDNGYYTFDHLKGGPYLIKAVSHDQLSEVTKRTMAGNRVMLTLRPYAKLNVQFDMKHEPGLSSGMYRYIYTPDSGEPTSTEWMNYSEEYLLIEDLMPGVYQIEARSDNTQTIFHSKDVHLEMGETRFVSVPMTNGDIHDASAANDHSESSEADLAAKSKFQSANEEFQNIMLVSLAGLDEQELQENLIDMSRKMQTLAPVYTDIIQNSHSSEWSVASFTNLGEMYYHVYDELLKSAVPAGLPDDVREEYENIVHQFANAFKTKSKDYYNASVDIATSKGVSSNYSERSSQRLQAFENAE